MSDLPVIGAAMTIADYETHHELMRELPRDIEIQDFFDARLLNGDWASVAEKARKLLDGHTGRIGIHGPVWGFNIASQDPDVRDIVRRKFHQGLDVCEAIGANQMVIHSPYSTWDYNNLDNLPNARASVVERTHETIADVVKRAEDIGCVLVVENIEDVDPQARVDLVKSFQSEAIAVSIDTGHACYAPLQSIIMFTPRATCCNMFICRMPTVTQTGTGALGKASSIGIRCLPRSAR